MKSTTPKMIVAACAGVLASLPLARAADKVNFEDHLSPLLRNECTACHNPDKKKAGLDLSSYQAMMAGSENGPIINPGDPADSLLYKVVAHLDDPYMPKGKEKLPDKEIAVFKAFIAAGALPTATGKALIVRAKPRINLAVASDNTGKPTGPVAMPKDLILQPVIHTQRPGALLCLAASPWAPLVAVGGQHQVLLYNTDSLELVGVLPWSEGDPYTAKFSRNGSVLLVGGGVAAKSGHVVLFDVVTGKRITQIGDEFDVVLAADISPDQSTVALGGPAKVLKIYSTADGTLLHDIKKHTDWVTAIGYSPDGVLLASGDRQGGLWVWEAKSGNEFYSLTGHKAAITDVCFRGDSNILASASEDGTVKLWDMRSGKLVRSFQADPGGVLSVHFTHDGRIVTCGRDRRVHLWRADGSPLANSKEFADIALHAAFDGDGKRVVAGDWTGAIRVMDATTAKEVGVLTADPASIADRLAAAAQHVPVAQAAYDKAAADLAAAQKASDKSATDLQAANLASAQAAKAIEQSKAMVQSTLQGIEAARAAMRVAAQTVASRQSDAARLAQARTRAEAVRAACEREKNLLAATVATRQKASAAAAQTAVQTKAAANQAPNDAKLASAAKDAQAAADRSALALADAGKTLGAKGDQLSALVDQSTKARVQAEQAEAALTTAHDEAAHQQAAVLKAAADHQAADAAVARAYQSRKEADNLILVLTRQTKTSAEQLAKAKPPSDAAFAQLASARIEVARLKAARFNLTVWDARHELTAQQLELEKLKQASVDDKSAIAKAAADIASLQRELAQAPQLIAAAKNAAIEARLRLVQATTARDAAEGAMVDWQMMAKQSADSSAKLAAASAQTPADKSRADAATKAKAAADADSANATAAEAVLSDKTTTATAAESAASSADAALASLSAEIANGPKTLESLKQAIAAATADLSKKRLGAETSTKAVAAAQAHVNDLAARYEKLSQEASITPALQGHPKG